MEVPRPITPDDFPEIEKHMKAMIKANVPFQQETWTYDAARKWFSERDQKFKLELIEGISDREVNASDEGVADEGVSIYHNGDFTDLCKGPHVEKTGECRYFKLLRVSGALLARRWQPRAVTTHLRHRMGDQSRPSGILNTTRRSRQNATIADSDAN